MNLTKKRKQFLAQLLSPTFVLGALDYNYENDEKKEFKAQHGISFKEAEDALEALRYSLRTF